MMTREQIQEERKGKGFCQCHECIERDYEQRYAMNEMMKMVKRLARKKHAE